jgi:ribosomal protein S18 acetylase RimI-like enzyme
MNSVLIREARESDLSTIEKLTEELIESIENKEGINHANISRNFQDLLKDSNSYILVAELNETVVGFISFSIRKTLLHIAPSGQIDELIVNKNHRHGGIGKLLMQAAIEKCKHLGCCEVEVSTETTNDTAREFYKMCGFKEKGVILEKDLL